MLKATLRTQYLQQRSLLSSHEASDASRQIQQRFLESHPISDQEVIALYNPIGNEVDTNNILNYATQHGVPTVLPVVTKQDAPLIFRQYQSGDALRPHPNLKVMEPEENAVEKIATILLVPLVAFNIEGYRIGFGGGYYDRTLSYYRQHHPNVLAIGLAYDWQQCTEFIPDAFDQPLDKIITETEIFDCTAF